MTIKTLEGISSQEILEVFNHSFSDYFIPFKLTHEQLVDKMKADRSDLSLSVGAFENEKLVAFILHGFDTIDNKKVVYNGGTGVIPENRGAGLTKQMYSFILPLLKEKGIDKLILEVISNNVQAIKSYEKSGFKVKRTLACYKGIVNITMTNPAIEIKPIDTYDWQLMQSFWNVSPTWQNSNNTLNTLKSSNISLGAYVQNKLVGYIIYNPTSQRIQQIAVYSEFRKQKIGTSLMSALLNGNESVVSVINVDKNSKKLNGFFEHLGLKNTLDQLEMELKLNTKI
ncbi:GNAT family N-acetyltransferase [uncultured Tenacibaculum sp.]|uniref:GNAT family N-acetyltransferase n=1 Tax=uncultured Tenacibaculum sp. TaxID=174713 RepID=UPI00260C60DC|nr:GNAT family N-acetyltransferase [uncultured Tenacibaculum sp.]